MALAACFPASAQTTFAHPVLKRAATAQLTTADNFPACDRFTADSGDPSKGPSVFFARLAPGCLVPWHWHTPNETVMVVSGILLLQAKGGQPARTRHGDYAWMPSHHIHLGKCVSSAPCTFFVSSDAAFDIHYVNAAGREIPAAEALKAVREAPGRAQSAKH